MESVRQRRAILGEPVAFWGRTANYLPWQLSLLVENTEADEWVYAVDERVRLPLYQAAGPKGSSGDTVVASICAKLSVPGRGWLRDAPETAHPGHHWIGLLS